MPKPSPRDVRPGWPRPGAGHPPAVLAHRGGRGPWRENTVAAFAGAFALGADGVELDVRRSADGVVVVHHDAVAPGIGPVAEHAARSLPPWVPTLAQALDACAGRAVNVELKLDPPEVSGRRDRVLAESAGAGLAGTACAVVVSSFWPLALAAMREVDGGVDLGLLVHPALDAGEALAHAGELGCASLHPHISQVTPQLVGAAHDLGLAVTTWTVNDADELALAVASGVDAVITDEVAATIAALRRR